MSRFLGSVLVLFVLAIFASATPVIQVTPALAPNVYGSPNWTAWQANAVYALAHGLSSYGTPGTPEYYEAGDTYDSAQVIVTGFPSWMGLVNPGAVFGPAFTNEHGNRMHFGLVIDGQGTQFSISQLSFSGSSTDPGNALGWGRSGYVYDDGYQGVLAGLDHTLWTADDMYITSGDPTQLVDGLVGRGSGNSFDAYCDPCSPAQQQAALDAAAAQIGGPYHFTGVYSLTDGNGGVVTGSGTFNIDIPEPATWLLALPVAVLWLRRRRVAG